MKYKTGGYSIISDRYIPEHRLVWEKFMGVPIPKGYVIHHIDGNKQNNDILNLVMMDRIEHASWHSRRMNGMKNRKHSEESKEKMRIHTSGELHPFFGTHRSEETRRKIGEAQKGIPRPLVTCPHCNKTGHAGAMHKHHFKNCKKLFTI